MRADITGAGKTTEMEVDLCGVQFNALPTASSRQASLIFSSVWWSTESRGVENQRIVFTSAHALIAVVERGKITGEMT